MFNPNLHDVRGFFFETYDKGQANQVLTALEKIAFSIILEHPEYHYVLKNPEKFYDHQWLPDAGETNPFLHMSLHMSIHEQLSIDQPQGIKAYNTQLCVIFGNEHEAQHHILDCLGEMIWQSQYTNNQPDPKIYFACLDGKIEQYKKNK